MCAFIGVDRLQIHSVSDNMIFAANAVTAMNIAGDAGNIERLAAIISLVGAIQVFTMWQRGDANVISRAVGWFGSAIFLIVAITIIKTFFGIG